MIHCSYCDIFIIVVTVSFTEREYSESEGARLRIGLQLNRVIDQTITVQVEIAGITAEGQIPLIPYTLRNVLLHRRWSRF